jgi:cyclophilin family peptidyl-prolyl cis-trans isomerase
MKFAWISALSVLAAVTPAAAGDATKVALETDKGKIVIELYPDKAPKTVNGLKNQRGTLAMARTQVPDSATAQFFINTVDNDFLDFKNKTIQGWGYAVFGKVVEGMDVVDAITKVKTANRGGHQDVPVDTVMIIKAERVK